MSRASGIGYGTASFLTSYSDRGHFAACLAVGAETVDVGRHSLSTLFEHVRDDILDPDRIDRAIATVVARSRLELESTASAFKRLAGHVLSGTELFETADDHRRALRRSVDRHLPALVDGLASTAPVVLVA